MRHYIPLSLSERVDAAATSLEHLPVRQRNQPEHKVKILAKAVASIARPLIISQRRWPSRPYNKKVGLALFCPITFKVKGYPFEVELPSGLDVSGTVLSDQIKSFDWRSHRASRIGAVPDAVPGDVLAKLSVLVAGD